MVAPIGFAAPRVSLPTDAIAQAHPHARGRGRSEPATVPEALKQIFGQTRVPVLKQPLKANLIKATGNGQCNADPIRLELLQRIVQLSNERLSPEMRQLSRLGQTLLGWKDVDAENAGRQQMAERLHTHLNDYGRCVPPSSQSSLQGAVDAFLQQHSHLLLK
jgi:hypothetical protein